MHLRLTFAAVGLLASPVNVALAPAASAATTETFLGCPAGFAMATLPDPRALATPFVFIAPRTEQLIVVQCVGQRLASPPACPAGMIKSAVPGRDTCIQAQRGSSGTTVTDGSSNTAMVGETARTPTSTATDGSSNTIILSESPPNPPSTTTAKVAGTVFSSVPQTSFPACTAPATLAVDPAGRSQDVCLIRTVALPADQVSVTR